MAFDNVLRLQVQKNLSAILADISILNGYSIDMPFENIFRGRAIFGTNDPLPMLSILEVPIPLDQRPSPKDSDLSSGTWELMIQGWVKDDKDNPTDPAHPLLADVKKRLVLERRKASEIDNPEDGILGLGNHVTGLRIGPGVVRPPDQLSAKAYFWLTITLDLAEDLADPLDAKA